MADPDAEQDAIDELATLPRGAVTDSFRIFATWMRENRRAIQTQTAENRQALQSQIAGLALRFEEVDRENKRRLNEIHNETRRTNGRVTDLEKTTQLATALADGHEEWETGRERTDREATEARERRREKFRDRLIAAGLVILGAVVGHASHLPLPH